jgi:hypothetical protein
VIVIAGRWRIGSAGASGGCAWIVCSVAGHTVVRPGLVASPSVATAFSRAGLVPGMHVVLMRPSRLNFALRESRPGEALFARQHLRTDDFEPYDMMPTGRVGSEGEAGAEDARI